MIQHDIRPFDLTRLDTEGNRRRKRRRLLLWSLPLMLLLTLTGLKIMLTTIPTSLAIRDFNVGSYDRAHQKLAPVFFLNVIEPYKAYFNDGTLLLHAKAYPDAQKQLARSLELAPIDKECTVRVNLSLAYLGEADALADEQKYDDAIIIYDKLIAVVDGRDCGLRVEDNHASEETKTANETLRKLSEQATTKQNNAKQARNGDKVNNQVSDSTNNADDADKNAPSEAQQQKLRDEQARNEKNVRTQNRNQRERGSTDSYNSRAYDRKTW